MIDSFIKEKPPLRIGIHEVKLHQYMLTYQSMQTKLMTLDHEKAVQIAELFATLGDASRVRIIASLIKGEMNVNSLTEEVGISQSAVSHHLRILRQMRFVRARKNGREVFYRLDDEHIAELFQRGVEHVLHA